MTIKLFTQTRKELIFVPIKKRWTHFQTTNHCLCFKSDYDEYLVQDTNGFFHITLGMGELRDFEIVNKLSELKEDQTKEYVQSVDGRYIGKDTTVYHKSKDAFISWLKYIAKLPEEEDYMVLMKRKTKLT